MISSSEVLLPPVFLLLDSGFHDSLRELCFFQFLKFTKWSSEELLHEHRFQVLLIFLIVIL